MAVPSFFSNLLGAFSAPMKPHEACRNSYVGIDTLLKSPDNLAKNPSIFTDHIASLRSEIQTLQINIGNLKKSVVKQQKELFRHYQRFYIHCDHAAKTIQQTVKVIHQEATVPYVKSRVLDPIEKLFFKDSSLSINETVKQIMKNREYYVKVCSDVQIKIINYLREKGNLTTTEQESQIKNSLTVIFSQPKWNNICEEEISSLVGRFKLSNEWISTGQKQHLEKLLKAIVGSQSKKPNDQCDDIKNALETISGGGTFKKHFNYQFQMGLLHLDAGGGIPQIDSNLETTLAKPADIWLRMQDILTVTTVTEDEENQFFNVLSSAGIDLDTKEKREVFKFILEFNYNIQEVKNNLSLGFTSLTGLALSDEQINQLEPFLMGNKSVEQVEQWVLSCLALTRIPNTEYDTILGEFVEKIQAATEKIKERVPWRLRSYLRKNSQRHYVALTEDLSKLKASSAFAPQSPESTLWYYIEINRFRRNPSKRRELRRLMVAQPDYVSALKWVNDNFPREINVRKKQELAKEIEQTAKRYDKTVVESAYTNFYKKFEEASKMPNLSKRRSRAQDSIVKTAPAALSRCMDTFSDFSDAQQALGDINRVNASIEDNKLLKLEKQEALQSKQMMLELMLALLKKGFYNAASAYRDQNQSFSLFHGDSGRQRVDDIISSVDTAFKNKDIDALLAIIKSEMKNASKSTGYIFQGKSAMRKTSFNRYLVFELLRVIKIVCADEGNVDQQTLKTFVEGFTETQLALNAARSKESALRDGAKSVLNLINKIEGQQLGGSSHSFRGG
jgi:hypothetical protein